MTPLPLASLALRFLKSWKPCLIQLHLFYVRVHDSDLVCQKTEQHLTEEAGLGLCLGTRSSGHRSVMKRKLKLNEQNKYVHRKPCQNIVLRA